MTRWLRVCGGYTQRLDTAVANDGRAIADIPPMVDAWFGKVLGRVMRAGFDPVVDDPRMQMPEPGEPIDGLHGDGGFTWSQE